MRERESVSILIAAALAALLVITMGSADVVRVLTTAARAQTAADAAALAAAQAMAIPGQDVPADVARTYAAHNGGSLHTCECEPDSFEAIVTIRMPVGDLFLSGDDRAVTASARAIVDLPSL